MGTRNGKNLWPIDVENLFEGEDKTLTMRLYEKNFLTVVLL